MRLEGVSVTIAAGIAVILLVSSCSAVPGDAAVRAGEFRAGADLYKRGAEQGDAQAALRLAFLISAGRVPTATYGSPFEWFVRACDLGENAGCHNAGFSYEYGKNGVTIDYLQARAFYLRAAIRGYAQSQ